MMPHPHPLIKPQHIDFSGLECLNEAPNHGVANVLKQGYREQDELYLESDTDEQVRKCVRSSICELWDRRRRHPDKLDCVCVIEGHLSGQRSAPPISAVEGNPGRAICCVLRYLPVSPAVWRGARATCAGIPRRGVMWVAGGLGAWPANSRANPPGPASP